MHADLQCCYVAFQDAPEELDVTIIEPAGEQSGAVERAAAALTAEVCALCYHVPDRLVAYMQS